MNTTYLFIQCGFALLTTVFFALLFLDLKNSLGSTTFSPDRKKKILIRSILLVIGWTILTSILSITGFLSDFNGLPPRLFFILLVPLIAMIIVMNVKATGEILQHTPPHVIIRLQVFRVFVELLLWALFAQNLLPKQMTFEGRNFDILVGLTAPLIAWLYQHQKVSKTVVVIWNFAGLALLLNIVVIAILSMPTPFRVFMNEPANTIVARFPIVWLPALLVPLAYWLHLLSIKQLMLSKR